MMRETIETNKLVKTEKEKQDENQDKKISEQEVQVEGDQDVSDT